MADVILHCACGTKVNAPGAIPGRVGRCPNCGNQLRVPDVLPQEPIPQVQLRSVARQFETSPNPEEARPRARKRPRRRVGAKPSPSAAGGLLPTLDEPERGIFGSFLYPFRGADGMGIMAILAVAFWFLGSSAPEYCLSLIATAESTGRGLLGILISLITAIPLLIAVPFLGFYWLAYLGRVLESGAKGETVHPRSPDRNFDGFLSAMTPWLIWLFWGFGVGFAPAISVLVFARPRTRAALWTAAGLGLLGYCYALMALIQAHVKGHAGALNPFRIVGAMLRLVIPFVGRGIVILVLNFAVLAAFFLSVLLRDNYFGIYLLARLGCCAALSWASIASMRILGIFAYHHRAVLRD